MEPSSIEELIDSHTVDQYTKSMRVVIDREDTIQLHWYLDILTDIHLLSDWVNRSVVKQEKTILIFYEEFDIWLGAKAVILTWLAIYNLIWCVAISSKSIYGHVINHKNMDKFLGVMKTMQERRQLPFKITKLTL